MKGEFSILKEKVEGVRSESVLYGKTFNIIGDSYVAGHTLDVSITWSAKLAAKYNMTYNNYGINGNALTVTTISGPPVLERYTEMADNADYVIVVGGKNDYNYHVPIADLKTGLETLLDGLINKYLGKKIGFITPWNIGSTTNGIGLTLYDYVAAMEELCKIKSVPCFDASANSGVYMFNASFRATYCLNSEDVSHLNEAGHNYVLPKFESYITSL
jgi:hypothetical protein